MFLKLSRVIYEGKVRININTISTYEYDIPSNFTVGGKDNTTLITLKDGSYLTVKETPDEIDCLLTSSYVTVKEGYENRTSEVQQHPSDSTLNDSEQLQSRSCGSSCEHCSCL